jgi:hypothetical protein
LRDRNWSTMNEGLEEAAAMRPNYGEEVWSNLYRRRHTEPGRPKGVIASVPKEMVMSQALHTCAGVRACLGKAVMHELSRRPGLAAAAVCTTSGLSQVAARQPEPAYGLQPYKLIFTIVLRMLYRLPDISCRLRWAHRTAMFTKSPRSVAQSPRLHRS